MNDLLKQFEGEGWKFSSSNGIIWFKSPRMYGERGLWEEKTVDDITVEKLIEAEKNAVLSEWEEKVLRDFDEKVLHPLVEEYSKMQKRGIEPPKTQKISFDIEFPSNE